MKLCWVGIHKVSDKWFWYRKKPKTQPIEFRSWCQNCNKFIVHGKAI